MDISNEEKFEGPDLFIAKPSDDIPRNKLTESLSRGLQAHVQAMQKRESFFAEFNEIKIKGWSPAPRENATLTHCNDFPYLIGGMNYETNKEIT